MQPFLCLDKSERVTSLPVSPYLRHLLHLMVRSLYYSSWPSLRMLEHTVEKKKGKYWNHSVTGMSQSRKQDDKALKV